MFVLWSRNGTTWMFSSDVHQERLRRSRSEWDKTRRYASCECSMCHFLFMACAVGNMFVWISPVHWLQFATKAFLLHFFSATRVNPPPDFVANIFLAVFFLHSNKLSQAVDLSLQPTSTALLILPFRLFECWNCFHLSSENCNLMKWLYDRLMMRFVI